MTASTRRTIAVDFDGVLHSYKSGWTGEDNVKDPPVPGAIDWLNKITETHNVALNSVRNNSVEGRAAMHDWLVAHEVDSGALDQVSMPAGKPPADVYVDDRAWRFEGDNFPSADDIENAVPWWKAP